MSASRSSVLLLFFCLLAAACGDDSGPDGPRATYHCKADLWCRIDQACVTHQSLGLTDRLDFACAEIESCVTAFEDACEGHAVSARCETNMVDTVEPGADGGEIYGTANVDIVYCNYN